MNKWDEARERMRPYIDAVLWQDLGVESPHRERSIDYILDKIIKLEFQHLGNKDANI